MFHKGKHNREKQLRFSIRKVSFGAASVAVAALFMFLGNGAVSAAEQGVSSTNGETQAPQPKDQNVQNGTYEGNTVATSPAATVETNTQPSTVENSPSTESAPQKVETLDKKELTEAEKEKVIEANDKLSDAEKAAAKDEAKKAIEVATASSEGNKPKNRSRRAAEPNSTTTDTTSDEAANQVYTAPQANAGLDELKEKLEQLPSAIQNNTKINNMDGVGATTGVEAGKVKEVTEFGGWKAVNQADGSAGKFVVARTTDKGVFPIETINTVGGSRMAWIGEQSIDRNSKYMLFLSEVRTQATRNKESYEGQPYKEPQDDVKGDLVAIGVKGYKGVEKTFKVYDTKTPGKVTVDFKTGFSGIVEGRSGVTVANYKVEVFSVINGVEKNVYTAEFDPKKGTIDDEKTVIAAKTSRAGQSVNVAGTTEADKAAALETLSKDNYKPYATGGRFTSKEIELPEGTTEYKVRISAANDRYLGMDYHSRFAQYALPLTGVDFNISQNTNVIAKDLLTKIYAKLKETVVEDEKGMTTDSIAAYDAELAKVKTLVEAADLTTTDKYKELLGTTLQKRQELKTDKEALTNAANADATATKATPAYYNAEAAKKAAYDKAVADAAPVLAKENATQAEVDAAKKAVDDAKAALDGRPTNKEALTNAANADATATKATPAYYNAEAAKKAAYDKAVADAAPVLAKENATQAEVDAAKKAVDDAKAALDGRPTNKEAAKAEVDATLVEKEKAIEANDKLSDAEKAAAKEEAKKAAIAAINAINEAKDQDGVDGAQTTGVEAIEAVTPVGKEKALEAIQTASEAKIASIDKNAKLSDDEKAAAKAEVAKAAIAAVKAINEAKDQDGVGAAQTTGVKAIEAVTSVGKEKALEAIQTASEAKIASIDKNAKLSDDEKAAAKAEVAKAAIAAVKAINEAKDQDGVGAAQTTGVKAIEAVTSVGKEKALEAIQTASEAKIASIDKNAKLSDDEKAAAKAEVAKAAIAAVKAINEAKDQDGVGAAQTTGVKAIEAVNPVGTSSTNNAGNGITPPTVEVPAYTESVGTSSTDGEGNVIIPPTVEVPAYTEPVGTSSTDGEGNVIIPPTVEVPAYTEPVGTGSTNSAGNGITPPTVEVPAYTEPVGTSSTAGDGKVVTPPTAEVPAYTGSVNGISEEMPAQPHKNGSANEMSDGTPVSETTINKDRQLPNTGTADSTVAMVAAAASAILGLGLAGRRRKEDEEA